MFDCMEDVHFLVDLHLLPYTTDCCVQTTLRQTIAEGNSRRLISPDNKVWCHYSPINLLQNPHKKHPIARPWGTRYGHLLWFENLICILRLSSQCRMWYTEKLNCVIMALDCKKKSFSIFGDIMCDSLWPGDVIWRHRSGSLVQVMACRLLDQW